jgi:hypothetical protein
LQRHVHDVLKSECIDGMTKLVHPPPVHPPITFVRGSVTKLKSPLITQGDCIEEPIWMSSLSNHSLSAASCGP